MIKSTFLFANALSKSVDLSELQVAYLQIFKQLSDLWQGLTRGTNESSSYISTTTSDIIN